MYEIFSKIQVVNPYIANIICNILKKKKSNTEIAV